VYYKHTVTKQRQWAKPPDFDDGASSGVGYSLTRKDAASVFATVYSPFDSMPSFAPERVPSEPEPQPARWAAAAVPARPSPITPPPTTPTLSVGAASASMWVKGIDPCVPSVPLSGVPAFVCARAQALVRRGTVPIVLQYLYLCLRLCRSFVSGCGSCALRVSGTCDNAWLDAVEAVGVSGVYRVASRRRKRMPNAFAAGTTSARGARVLPWLTCAFHLACKWLANEFSRTGRVYYKNRATRTTQWERPPEFVEAPPPAAVGRPVPAVPPPRTVSAPAISSTQSQSYPTGDNYNDAFSSGGGGGGGAGNHNASSYSTSTSTSTSTSYDALSYGSSSSSSSSGGSGGANIPRGNSGNSDSGSSGGASIPRGTSGSSSGSSVCANAGDIVVEEVVHFTAIPPEGYAKQPLVLPHGAAPGLPFRVEYKGSTYVGTTPPGKMGGHLIVALVRRP
jgi:hypothetical protein